MNLGAKVENRTCHQVLQYKELTVDGDNYVTSLVRCGNPLKCGVVRHEYKIPISYYHKPCYSCGAADHGMIAKIRATEGMIFTCPVSNLRAGEWNLDEGRMTIPKGTCFIEPELFFKYHQYDRVKIQDAMSNFTQMGTGQDLAEEDVLWLEERVRRVAGTSNYDEIPEADERSAYLGQEFWASVEGSSTSCMPCHYCGSSIHAKELDQQEVLTQPCVCPLWVRKSSQQIQPHELAEYYDCDAAEVNQALKNFRFWGIGRTLPKEEEFKFSQKALEVCFNNLRRLSLDASEPTKSSRLELEEQL